MEIDKKKIAKIGEKVSRYGKALTTENLISPPHVAKALHEVYKTEKLENYLNDLLQKIDVSIENNDLDDALNLCEEANKLCDQGSKFCDEKHNFLSEVYNPFKFLSAEEMLDKTYSERYSKNISSRKLLIKLKKIIDTNTSDNYRQKLIFEVDEKIFHVITQVEDESLRFKLFNTLVSGAIKYTKLRPLCRNVCIVLLNSANQLKDKDKETIFNILCKINKSLFSQPTFFDNVSESEKKYIVVVEDESRLAGLYDEKKSIRWILTKNLLPSNLQFENMDSRGPIIGAIYVKHPQRKNTYIKLDESAKYILREQRDNWRDTLLDLGASEIGFHYKKGYQLIKERDNSYGVRVDVEYKKVGGGVGYNNSKSRAHVNGQTEGEYEKYICNLRAARPIYKRKTWSDTREWEDLARQRLQGSIVDFKKEISNSDFIRNIVSDANEVNVNFNCMVAKANVGVNWANRSSREEFIETTWEMSVKFFPMSMYKQSTEHDADTSDYSAKKYGCSYSFNNSEEKEYYNEVVKCLMEGGGTISYGQRRTLEILRRKLNISVSRAEEIEKSNKKNI